MTHSCTIRKIALIGNDLPRKCGIATFTHDMYESLTAGFPSISTFVAAVNDRPQGYDYGGEVLFEFHEQELASYLRAADFLNFARPDVVSLQHEYGIFGGVAGSHINVLLEELEMPVVTTLHTVLKNPDPAQRRVMDRLCAISARLVVMTERGRNLLQEVHRVPDHKIDVIAHGIPDVPFVDPAYFKEQFHLCGKTVALTFGLLAPNKGIEHMLQALPRIVDQHPDFVYVILGATHPNLVRDQGETYRESLEQLARDLGVSTHVHFANRFVERGELLAYLGACDLYVTPYLNEAQITSGTLAYAFGCGKPVVSTPYWHAQELLAGDAGILVPFANSAALADGVNRLLDDRPLRDAMRVSAYRQGRSMIWAESARHYMRAFQKARAEKTASVARQIAGRYSGSQASMPLPPCRLDHLVRLTDSTGMLQHAVCAIPNYAEGYCTDDNARALLLTVLLEELGRGHEVSALASRYTAFLQYAFDPQTARFRNFMSYDRRWLEIVGSDDCHGRSIWALGTCVGRSSRRDLQCWLVPRFEQILTPILDTTSPRAWAFALLGLHPYLNRLNGVRQAARIRDELLNRLIRLYDAVAGPDWPWVENSLAYDNARIPQALILCGEQAGHARSVEIGLGMLQWLVDEQKSAAGHFRPIGSNGFYTRGGPRAHFDQQPLEACATVSACLAARAHTGQAQWLREARLAFEWFLGRNDLGVAVYDSATAGCLDGLHPDRPNLNQGAESTLAFLLALTELELAHTHAVMPSLPPGKAASTRAALLGRAAAESHSPPSHAVPATKEALN